MKNVVIQDVNNKEKTVTIYWNVSDEDAVLLKDIYEASGTKVWIRDVKVIKTKKAKEHMLDATVIIKEAA